MISNQKLKSFDIKNQTRIFSNLIKLLYKSFIREPRTIIFMVFVPIFFNLIFYFIMGKKIDEGSRTQLVMFSYTLLPALTIMTSLAPAVVEWKNSVFLKRIDITGIKKSMFLAALWTVYLIAGIICFFIMLFFNMGFSAILNSMSKVDWEITFIQSLGKINWAVLLTSVILIILTSIAIATFVGGLFSSTGSIQGAIMMIYFFSIFWSGIMLPPQIFETSQAMKISTYLAPHKYGVFLFLFATQGSLQEGWNSGFNTMVGTKDFSATWQPVLISISILTGIFILTSFTFKWTAKK